MSVTKEILYIKGDQNVEVKNQDVTLGDLVSMDCAQEHVLSKVKSLKFLKIPDQGKHRYVVSILKMIECIHKEYPNLEIQNVGATDIIVTYEGTKQKNRVWEACQVTLVVITCFIGAAFAIMAFNNDSGVPEIFEQIYEQFMGKKAAGFNILELTYSIGLGLGIIIFFNHFGKKKFTVDPTPIEVEMSLYENDIQTTLIAQSSRRGQELDVGKTNSNGSHRS